MDPTYASELRDIVRRQGEHLRRLEGARALMALPRFMRVLDEEPALTGICSDLAFELAERIRSFTEHDARGVSQLEEMWRSHSGWFLKIWGAERKGRSDHDAFFAYGHPEQFAEFLTAKEHTLPPFGEPSGESTTGTAIQKLRFWMGAVDKKIPAARSKDLASIRSSIASLEEQHDRSRRQFVLDGSVHAGAALYRLRKFSDGLLPSVVGWNPGEDNLVLLEKAAAWFLESQVSQAVFSHEQRDLARLPQYVEQMRRDVEVVEMELLGRIGLLLSHRALIMRFKQRCERFEADALRTAIERLGPQARREDYLTQSCARALFEEGLNPLFNAAIVRLRPDLFDPGAGWTLYVEAKQYSTLATLRANLKKASWQVWSTWSELEGARHVSEGFLLVFRLGGPLVQFETSVRFNNRTLYPIVVDLAPSDARGHAEREKPIYVEAAELLPGKLSSAATTKAKARGRRNRS